MKINVAKNCVLVCFINKVVIVIIQSFLKEKNMKKNMGTADRIIRITLAIVVGLLYYNKIITGTVGILLIVLAAIFIITSFVGFCPLYKLVGINSCSVKPKIL